MTRHQPAIRLAKVAGSTLVPVRMFAYEGHDFDREFLAGGRTKVIHDLTVIALPVSQPDSHDVLSICHDMYALIEQPHLQVVQLVFADEQGAFPWSSNYSASERQFQPVLGAPVGAMTAN